MHKQYDPIKLKPKKEYFGTILGKKIYWCGFGVETRCRLCAICHKLLHRGEGKHYIFHLPVCLSCRVKEMKEDDKR
jgi:hypothetical protein